MGKAIDSFFDHLSKVGGPIIFIAMGYRTLIDYSLERDSIRESVYSRAPAITPEVIRQADELAYSSVSMVDRVAGPVIVSLGVVALVASNRRKKEE